jgi:hypothetical protein
MNDGNSTVLVPYLGVVVIDDDNEIGSSIPKDFHQPLLFIFAQRKKETMMRNTFHYNKACRRMMLP